MNISSITDKNLKVLIVDDHSTMRILFRGMLRDIGINHIDEASDGIAALQKIKTEDFDLIMADWNMPYMTGLELLKEIRSDSKLNELPVLMVTSESKKENIIAAAQAGASGYILKPFSAKTLTDKLSKIIQNAVC